jgi:hypothetical protein
MRKDDRYWLPELVEGKTSMENSIRQEGTALLGHELKTFQNREE